MTGTVLRILHGKGFGFVQDEQGHRRFLHVRDLKNENQWLGLCQGSTIEFEPAVRSEPTPKNNGLGCAKVVVL